MKPLERMQLSLTGLSVGDALGDRFFGLGEELSERIQQRQVPPRWRYSDDTLHRYKKDFLAPLSVRGEGLGVRFSCGIQIDLS
ncbi:hypothetical protein [Coleofasciculus sp. H7-2]|uniref:hypothetical protein n=1 Tax=Coleofasciculus sp. H7-2 TaxID=3351545 RepID=UPI00366D06CC